MPRAIGPGVGRRTARKYAKLAREKRVVIVKPKPDPAKSHASDCERVLSGFRDACTCAPP